jgi:acetyl esterase/lipase
MQIMLMLGMVICALAGEQNNNKIVRSEQIISNISYGKDSQQKLDLYLPANRDTAQTKLMVLIHGGAWANGDKADFAPYIAQLKKQLPDYAFANINYRLYNYNGQNKFPTQENDIKAAIEFLRSKRAEYGFSDEIVLLGASAGAHLALLQGYKNADQLKPKAIISFFGPTDLEYLYHHPGYPAIPSLLATITGATPQQNKTLYQSYSPVNFVTPRSAPTLLLQGTADMLVPPVQANRLAHQLKEAGVVHEVAMYKGAGHGWTGAQLNDSFNKIVRFLQANVP